MLITTTPDSDYDRQSRQLTLTHVQRFRGIWGI